MNTRLSAVITLTVFLAVIEGRAGEPASDAPVRVRATVELTDGSRLIGTPTAGSLAFNLGYARLEIPLDRIRRWERVTHGGRPTAENDRPTSVNTVSVELTNGDRFTGTLDSPELQLDTILGPLAPKLKFVRGVSYAPSRESDMLPGEGDLAFDGFRWLAWRTEFAVEGDRLRSLPKPRPGFQYGHEGHGRGPILIANLGDSDWRDYSLECRYCATGVDPSFNPYGLGSDFHDGAILFHVADAKESQNVRGNSFYILGLHGDGSWELRAVYNHFCNQPIGWGNPTGDGDRLLAHGTGITLDRQNGNHLRVDVLGDHIRAWFENEKLVDVVDSQMTKEISGQRLDHGGVGFVGGFDGMFWIKDVSVRSIEAGEMRRSDEKTSTDTRIKFD